MLRQHNRLVQFAVVGLLISLCTLVWAQDTSSPPAQDTKEPAAKKPANKFIRVQRDEKDRPKTLETAIVRYRPASGEGDLIVDLVGVVHVADREYYEQLNKRFEQYDVVLYELVAPPDRRVPNERTADDGNLFAMFHHMTKAMLDLESQVERIDYTKANFVHADLSPEEMGKAIRERGDDGLTLVLSVTADMLRQENLRELERQRNPQPENPAEEVEPLAALFDPQGPLKLKRSMAEQMASLEGDDGGLGATLGTILIKDRNAAAMRVFQTELAKGKKRIAIFYGAAHMPDFEQRLIADFGLKHDSQDWLTAWDLSRNSRHSGFQRMFDLLKQ